MSLNLIKKAATCAGRLLSNRCSNGLNRVSHVPTLSVLLNREANIPNRFFTRSMWCLTSQSKDHVLVRQQLSGPCKCASCVHTQGDKQLLEFLSQEIQIEKENQTPLPKVIGFTTEMDGSDVVLKKQAKGETIVVKFSINHSIDPNTPEEFGDYPEEPEKQPPPAETKMTSKPSFSVEISKGSSDTLTINCMLTQLEPYLTEQKEAADYNADPFEIEEVGISDKEWSEQTYVVAGAVLDGNLYDLLMNMLEERGVDSDFAKQLSEFSTAYEHQSYVDFLQKLQSFTSK